jgi:hypothetical protein
VRPKRFLPDCREDPKGKSIAYFWASDAEGDVKIDELGLKSWAAIAEFLGQSVCASPEELTNWVSAERGKSEPVHLASEDSVADLKQGLSCVREQRKGRDS